MIHDRLVSSDTSYRSGVCGCQGCLLSLIRLLMSSVLPTYVQQASHPGNFHLQQRIESIDEKRKVAVFLSYAPDWRVTFRFELQHQG